MLMIFYVYNVNTSINFISQSNLSRSSTIQSGIEH
jgi:hypothetical protein